MNLEFTVPPDLTFEQSIVLTQDLLNASPSDDLLSSAVTALIATPNGARGFFVVFLTGDYPVTPGLLQALRSNPSAIATLLTKNLLMPTAMAITHRRNGNEDLAAGSDFTRDRTSTLIQQLHLAEIYSTLTDLQTTLAEDLAKDLTDAPANDWRAFLDRWGYDDQQRSAIGHVINTSLAVQAS